MVNNEQRVLVTGGGTFLGDNIAAALLAEGASVTLLVRPGTEDNLGPLAQRVRWWVADVWDPSSLRGRSRGHQVVIHTVGSLIADPAQGLTHHRLNFLSARNVANMCVGDGVPHMVFMSGVRAPWTSRRYIQAKHEGESYLRRVGLQASVIRAPITYVRGQSRPWFYQLMTLLGSVPPISWLGFGRFAPMPIDILARGVARIALDKQRTSQIYYAPDLRKRNTRNERRGRATFHRPAETSRTGVAPQHPLELLDEDAPFGWVPPESTGKR